MIEYPEEFEEFWKIYPRKRGKLAALKAYLKVKKLGATDAEIIVGAKRFAEYYRTTGQEERYTKLAGTWLNAGCWDDEYSSAPRMPDRKPTYADSLQAAAQSAANILEEKYGTGKKSH